jgi:hypothetical protein
MTTGKHLQAVSDTQAEPYSEYQIYTKARFCATCGLELVLRLTGRYDTRTGKPEADLVCPVWACDHTGHSCEFKKSRWYSLARCASCGRIRGY